MNPIKIGVIGAGYWGKIIIEEFFSLSKHDNNVCLTAVSDVDPETRIEIKRKYDIPLISENYRDLLTSSNVDAVHICTPNETHFKICEDALNAGKHVLIEKPMTLISTQAHQLIALAKKENLTLLVGHVYRFNNALQKIRELIKENFLGKIYHLRLQWTTKMVPPTNRDIITDLSPHPFDIINLLTDEWPTKVDCTAHSYLKNGGEEMAYINLILKNDVTAHIELSWLLPGKKREITIIGSKRTVICDCLKQEIQVIENKESYNINVEQNNTVESEIKHFINIIQNNNTHSKGRNDGNVGAKVVEMVEYSITSNQSQRRMDTLNNERSLSKYSILEKVRIGHKSKIYDQVNLYKCRIGNNTKIDAFTYIEEDVEIGDNCKIRPFTFIPTGVCIEDNVFIGPNVVFTNDKYPKTHGNWNLLKTRVKKGVSIGANCVILPGITIGENAMIGAGSVVTKDVIANSIVVGNPARPLKKNNVRI